MNAEENVLHCDLCQEKFTCSSKLTTHKQSHSGEEQLCCSFCRKAFTVSGDLIRHK